MEGDYLLAASVVTAPFLSSISQPDALDTEAYRPITMASRGVSTLKFVGTVSLGLLTVSLSSLSIRHPRRAAGQLDIPRTWAAELPLLC